MFKPTNRVTIDLNLPPNPSTNKTRPVGELAPEIAHRLLAESLVGHGSTLQMIAQKFGMSSVQVAHRIRAHAPAYISDADLNGLLRIAMPEAFNG